jgi:hypothetical protein
MSYEQIALQDFNDHFASLTGEAPIPVLATIGLII